MAKRGFSQVVKDMMKVNMMKMMSTYEMRISGARVEKVLRKLGWGKMFCLEAQGFSRGFGWDGMTML